MRIVFSHKTKNDLLHETALMNMLDIAFSGVNKARCMVPLHEVAKINPQVQIGMARSGNRRVETEELLFSMYEAQRFLPKPEKEVL